MTKRSVEEEGASFFPVSSVVLVKSRLVRYVAKRDFVERALAIGPRFELGYTERLAVSQAETGIAVGDAAEADPIEHLNGPLFPTSVSRNSSVSR